MLNEKRVRLMTKMASYEESEGQKNIAVGTYFRGDYISKEIIKSVIYGTIAFGIVFAFYLLYDMENFMQDIYKMDLLQFGRGLLIKYLEFNLIYGIITYVVYTIRYRKARQSLRMYYNNLRRLEFMYRKEKNDEE